MLDVMYPNTASSKEEEKCGTCRNEFTAELATLCEGPCNQLLHMDCAGLTQGEFDIMKRNKCKLTELCKPKPPKMEEQAINLSQMNRKIESTMNFIKKDLTKIIEETVIKILEQNKENRPTVIREAQNKAPPRKTQQAPPPNGNTAQALNVSGNSNPHDKELDGEEPIQEVAPTEEEREQELEDNNATWTEVVKVRSCRQRNDLTITGTLDPSHSELQAGMRNAWLYIGKWHQSTTIEKIEKFTETRNHTGYRLRRAANQRIF
jgi:hypothetical protein